jgi:uncharacterized protein YkwD
MDLITAHRLYSLKLNLKPHRYLVAAFFLVLLTLINSYWYLNHRTYQRIQGATTDLSTSEIIALTNLERARNDLPALVPNDLLTQAALNKAQNMIKLGIFDHYYQSQEGANVNPWQFILDQGYQYHHAGENLARDFFSAEKLVQAWMDSDAHRANLLSPQYTEIGVAVIEGPFLDKDNTTLVVQLFATPLPKGVVVVEREGFDQINVAPILTNEVEEAGAFFNQYPPVLIAASIALLIIAIGTVFFDVIYFHIIRRHALHPPSNELWHH